MSETIDDLTVTFEEDGQVVVEELDKEVLSKGAWTTVLFHYRELNVRTGEFGEPKATIRRYQKQQGVFKQKSKFNISSAKQAIQISLILQEWFADQT